jgi:thioredoxin-related protein
MEAESFAHPEIVQYLNDHFITIRTNVDKEKKIASAYFVRTLPSSWFLEPDGSKITSIPGYVDPDTFLIILNYIASDSYKKMTLKEFANSKRSK